jgi:D-aspartate ligase
VRFSIGPSTLDTTVPVLLLKSSHNVMQHGTLGIIRSLGRLGVPVYATVEDRFAPPAMSRYTAGFFLTRALTEQGHIRLANSDETGEHFGRPTILVPTDDSGAVFVAEHANPLSKWFLFPRVEKGLPRRLANKKVFTHCAQPSGCHARKPHFPPAWTTCSSLPNAPDFQ